MFELLAASLAVQPLPVESVPTTRHEQIVRFGDLDLKRPGDVQRLAARLRFAVKSVCGPVRTDVEAPFVQKCRTDAMARASEELARLTAR